MEKPTSSRAGRPTAGDVLIASRSLNDPNFAQTLVYLHEHDAEGSLGFILNRPLEQSLGQILPVEGLPEVSVYFGGPVRADAFLLALFRCNPYTHHFTCELGPDPGELARACKDPNHHLVAFVGYAGWAAGQLEAELARGDWLWTAPDEVMLRPSCAPLLWDLLVEGDYRWQALRDYLPKNPERN